MGLYDFILKQQKKPPEAKKRILVFLLIISFIILATAWIFIFQSQIKQTNLTDFSASSDSSAQLGGQDLKSGLISPLAALKDGVIAFKNDVFEKIDLFKTTAESIKNFKEQRIRKVYELPIE